MEARAGRLKGFTGIDDPYEPPERPELVLDTVLTSAEANAQRILEFLGERGFVRAGLDGELPEPEDASRVT